MMRLGTRWRAGDPPPHSIPAALAARITQIDAETLAQATPGKPTPSWTLTWLESAATAECDNGVAVRMTPIGDILTFRWDE